MLTTSAHGDTWMRKNDHARMLYVQLLRSRRAMLWAIVERQPAKAASHARKAARYARLIRQCEEKYGGRSVFTS